MAAYLLAIHLAAAIPIKAIMIEYASQQAIQAVASRFSLPPPDPYSQFWEFEISVPELLDDLLLGYETSNLGDEERFCLMAVILSSFEENLVTGHRATEERWAKIVKFLRQDQQVHSNLIERWADRDSALEDRFILSERMAAAFPLL